MAVRQPALERQTAVGCLRCREAPLRADSSSRVVYGGSSSERWAGAVNAAHVVPSRTDARGISRFPTTSYVLATMALAQAMRDDLLSTLFARHAGPGNRPCRVRDDTRYLYTILVLACMSGWRKDGHQSVTMLKGMAYLPFFPFFQFSPGALLSATKKKGGKKIK